MSEPDRIAAIQAPEAPHVNPDYAECWQSGWRAGFQAASDRLAVVERERDDWKEKHRLQGEAHLGDMRMALADLDKVESALLTLQRQVRQISEEMLQMGSRFKSLYTWALELGALVKEK